MTITESDVRKACDEGGIEFREGDADFVRIAAMMMDVSFSAFDMTREDQNLARSYGFLL